MLDDWTAQLGHLRERIRVRRSQRGDLTLAEPPDHEAAHGDARARLRFRLWASRTQRFGALTVAAIFVAAGGCIVGGTFEQSFGTASIEWLAVGNLLWLVGWLWVFIAASSAWLRG
jgi:hypothetical protein